MIKDNALVAGVVAIVAFAAFGFFRPVVNVTSPPAQVTLGGTAGPTHTGPEQFLDQVFVSRQGDLDASLPGVTTSTGVNGVTVAKICQNSVVDVTLALTGQSVILPSSSAMFDPSGGCLGKVGDYRTFFIQNASGTNNLSLAVSDPSSTIRVVANNSSSVAGVNGTSSLNFGDIAQVTAIRTVSSTSVWLKWIVTVFR